MSFSSPTNRTASDIRNDIGYNEVLLAQLDPRTGDHPYVKQRIEQEIQIMKDQLRLKEAQIGRGYQSHTLDDLTSTHGQYGQQNTSTLPLTLPPPRTSELNHRFPNSFGHLDQGGHFASDSAVMAPGDKLGLPSGSVPQSTNSRNFSGAFAGGSLAPISSPGHSSSESSPALPMLPTINRKRPREPLSLSRSGPSKSMRATPSPAPTTRATTPVSFSSEFPDDPELLKMLGSHPHEDLLEIREIEREFEERKDQERKDREFAQRMQEEQYRPSSGSSTSHSFGIPSLLSRVSSQATTDPSSKSRAPEPPSSNAFAASSNPLTFASLNPRNNESASRPTLNVKEETSFTATPRRNEFPNFIDLGSDDEDESDYGSGIPSSELMEISPSEFPSKASATTSNALTHPSQQTYENNFGSRGSWTDIDPTPSTVPDHWNTQLDPTPSAFQGYGDTNIYSANGYPNSVPTSSNWSDVFNNVGQTLSNAATSAMNGVYGMIDGQYQGLPTNYPGYSTLGSSANPQLIGDYDHHGMPDPNSNFLTPNINLNQNYLRNEAYQEYMERINNYSGDSRTSIAELKSLLENIRPDEQIPAHSRVGTPDAMSITSPLYEHQKLGLTWLQQMEAGSNKGGILADDMGLGKTVQAIALMVTRRSTDPDRKSTLIVAPVALLKQWEREIQLRLKPTREHRLSTYIYHNKGKKVSWDALRQHDVVLTTYGTLASEGKRKELIDDKRRANPNWRPSMPADQLPLLGAECKWYRVILDEAQCIKNKDTRAARAAIQLEALSRFCMSGTPMMNSVNELYSLIHFLRIKPYNAMDKFRAAFSTPLKSMSAMSQESAMKKLQALLKAILLRRTKKSIIDGKPILELPERVTEIQHAVFTDDEESFYRSLETKTRIQFNKYLKANTIGRNYSNVLVLLLRLRQACCHPHLIKDIAESTPANAEVSIDDMIVLAQSLAPDVVSRIKDQGSIECPICMDSAENATIFIPCGHSTCRECFARIQDPSQAIADDGGLAVKCPNCRGKVDPKKVTDFKSFKKAHLPQDDEVDALDDPDPENDVETASDSESESESDSDEREDDTLDGFIVPDDVVDDATESEQDEHHKPAKKSKPNKKQTKDKGKGKEKLEPKTKLTLAQLQKESRKNAKSRKRYLRRLRRDWQTSAKITKTVEILQSIEDAKTGEKTIIFSQFTSLLDLLEIPIGDHNWGYRRYDGSMSATARNDAVIDFSDKKDCKILLVSLKAGNAGLNLTAASQVIIFDPFWNPYIEEQAIDRAHRIGQRLPVQVHRILVPNTVEDRIITLQEKKRKLIEGALDEKASQNIGRLGERELAFLFGVPH